MKAKITFLLLILHFSIYGQERPQVQVFLSQNKKQINSGDFIDIQSFKNIEINQGSDTVAYEIQFVVIPFEGRLLSFSTKQHEMKSLDVLRFLEIGNISPRDIKKVTLIVRKNELSPELYSVDIFTRKLEKAVDFYEEFIRYAQIGDKESAIWLIGQAINLDASNVSYLNAESQLYYEVGEVDKSNDGFRKSAALESNYTAFIYLAFISADQGDYVSSKSFAEKSLNFTTNDVEASNAYAEIGDANAKMQDYSAAYLAYKKAIELNPENISALNNITTVLDQVNRSDEKVDYFHQILKVDPSFYMIHVNIGFYYLKKEMFDMALAEFDSVLKIDPNQALALNNKAFALMKLGRLDDALAAVKLSIQLEPTNSYAYRNKALILLEMNDSKAACLALNEAVKLNFTEYYGDEVLLLKKKNCK